MPPSSSRKRTESKKTPIRILCFGDSLTAGWPHDRAYAEAMRETLDAAFAAYHDVEVAVDGWPGDMVDPKRNGEFVPRMRALWKEDEYDWTVVLGGTNDLAMNVPVEDIIEGLQSVWDVPLSKGGKVLALTVPETKGQSPALGERRGKVNQMIKTYKKPGFFHHDLHASLPYHALAPADRARYWDADGLHLSAAGYDRLGTLAGDALVRIMRLAEAAATEMPLIGETPEAQLLRTADPRQRRLIEAMIWDEERGDPRLLSQGYIVVRKKDLD